MLGHNLENNLSLKDSSLENITVSLNELNYDLIILEMLSNNLKVVLQNQEVAKNLLKIAKVQYSQGKILEDKLLEAKINLSKLKITYRNLILDYNLSFYELKNLTGSLKDMF